MGKSKDKVKESTLVIEEIEGQLGEAFSKKKEEIERELEERIKKEKEEAKKRISQVEKEFEEERQALKNYRSTIKEFETNKANIKDQIKKHLDKAIQFQTAIENLTAQTLEELKKVSELNQKLDEFNKQAEEKASILKKDLEGRFGIVTEVFKANEQKEVEVNLEQELAKLRKIKELLTSPEAAVTEKAEEVKEAAEELAEEKVEKEEEAKEEEAAPSEAEAVSEEGQVEEKVKEKEEKEQSLSPIAEEKEAEEKEEKEGETGEPLASEEEEKAPSEKTFQDAFETLEQYRKSETSEDNGEISYFQKDEKMILDGECLISALSNNLDDAKKLYIRLTQTESPKDQFFIKQEIIRHQEGLRKTILRSVRMCEKESCSLPRYTVDIINMDVLKEILEKLSMENWSNQDDFTYFEKYSKNLKNNYYTRITPPALYLKSIIDELKIR